MPKTEKSAKIWRMVFFSSGLQIPLLPLQRGAGGIQNTRLFNYNLLRPNLLAINQAQHIHACRHSRCRDTPRVSANGKNDAPRHVNHL